jgi:uncharacterized protein YbaR (Trm112 family)
MPDEFVILRVEKHKATDSDFDETECCSCGAWFESERGDRNIYFSNTDTVPRKNHFVYCIVSSGELDGSIFCERCHKKYRVRDATILRILNQGVL